MSYDLKREEEVKQYVENLGIEYRFGCYKEKNPEACQMLADYLDAIKKDFQKAAKVYKSNCLDYNYGKSCLKIGNYCLLGKGREDRNTNEALTYFEKGCSLGDTTSCLHAGILLTATGDVNIKRDVPKGYNYLKKSCDQRDDLGCHYLCGMYISGVPKDPQILNKPGVDKEKIDYLIKPDYKQAFQFAMKACEYGNVYGCANVSMMYAKGDGVEKNAELAEKYKKITIELQRAPETAKELKFQQGLKE